MLAADIHLPAVAVYNFHLLADVKAFCSDIRTVSLVAGSAEYRITPRPAVRNRKIVDCRNQAAILKTDPQMHKALIHQKVKCFLAGIHAPDGSSGSFGQQGRDLLSLLLYGARRTLTLAFFAVLARLLIGTALGALSGWFSDSLLDRTIISQ